MRGLKTLQAHWNQPKAVFLMEAISEGLERRREPIVRFNGRLDLKQHVICRSFHPESLLQYP